MGAMYSQMLLPPGEQPAADVDEMSADGFLWVPPEVDNQAPHFFRVFQGDGVPVALFHGNMETAAVSRLYWKNKCLPWKLIRSLYSFEYPGFGLWKSAPRTTEALARALPRMAGTLHHLDGTCLIGRSLGGSVALQVALLLGDRVSSVILESTFLRPSLTRPLPAPIARFAIALEKSVLDPSGTFDNQTAIQSLHEATRVLVIHGDDDETVPSEHAHNLVDVRGRNARLLLVKSGGHNDLCVQHAQEVCDAIDNFLAPP